MRFSEPLAKFSRFHLIAPQGARAIEVNRPYLKMVLFTSQLELSNKLLRTKIDICCKTKPNQP